MGSFIAPGDTVRRNDGIDHGFLRQQTKGAKGIDDKGQGEVEDVTRRMVKLEVPAWREPLPAAVAAAGEGAAEVPAFAPLYAVYAPVKREPATATLIPYFAWANRGENEMQVWTRVRD